MKNKIKTNEYINWGFTIFCALAGAIVVYALISKVSVVWYFIAKVFKILSPIFIGLLFAYLLNPLVRYFENHASEWFCTQLFNDNKEHKKFKRVFAIFLTVFAVCLFVILLIIFVIPNLLDSLELMVTNVPTYINNIYNWLKGVLKNSPELAANIDVINQNVTEYVKNIMIPSMDTIASSVATGISGVINGIVNVFIGLVVSVYLLYDKESFLNGTDRLFRVILPKKVYDTTMTTLEYADKIFGGFMMAKIIDSLIIGIITFFILTIFGIPYSLLIAVIIGVTNIIPYFGPIIGAVPCALLLFMISPSKCVTFIILIFIIQQFDGNILGPRLIGNKTGIKSFWVLFAILLFGGLFGFVGMIFGVPAFALIYSLIQSSINKNLEKTTEKA